MKHRYNFQHFLMISGLLAALFLAGPASGQEPGHPEVLWDAYGVPHIYAASDDEMFYAYGWSQMTCHTDLILKLYAQARGRAAECMGSEYLDSDRRVLLFGLPSRSQRFYLEQAPGVKSCLDAFVRGINEYAAAHPEAIGETWRTVLPVVPTDVICHTLRIIYLEFMAGEDIGLSVRAAGAGSNAIAIAPSRSQSGNAMLLINPHLPWYDYNIWFEGHLNSPSFSAYGVCLVGTPTVTQGFNKTLGWAHTINPIDVSDRYVLEVKGDTYKLDNKWIPFEKKTSVIRVRQPGGSMAEQVEVFRYSVHGPVVAQNGNNAYAIRIAGMENTGFLEEYLSMGRATTFTEFENALKMMQIPMFNIIYADREGNIFYLFNGNVPVRKEGDFAFWKGTIDGGKSKYIWNGIHPYGDLPRLLNPSTGFIQNCNDAPWSCTYPFELKPERYPAYLSSRSFSLRAQRATNMVKDNQSISFDQLIEYKNNTEMEAANRFLDDLLMAVRNHPDTLAAKAAQILERWDRKTEADSRGAILFAAWWDRINGRMFRTPWNPDEPVSTPDGLKDEKLVVSLLSQAAGQVVSQYGSLDIAWGEVNRFTGNGHDYPANGGAGDRYGLFRTVYFADIPGNRKAAMAGETFIAAVEFGEKVRAMVCLSYGNATQEGNPHRGDQLALMSRKELRPALLERSEILRQVARQELLGPINRK